LESQIQGIDDCLAWLRPAYSSTADVWPIPFSFKNPDKRAGLANIMLWLGINKLDASTNIEKIPWQGILTIPIVLLMIMLLTIRKSKKNYIG